MERNFGSIVRKNRALIIRCDDDAYLQLLQFIKGDSRWYLIYSKSSNLKLTVKEEGY
jgi:hypothetical protein